MEEQPFQIVSEFQPMGDQPAAIDAMAERLIAGEKYSTLLGATGTGKTFTMAHTIARVGKPTLVLSHNKTLAAQLYEEFKELMPNNAVSYFVSYYDYYQPEAYIPQRDIYIEKDSSRNDDLDRLRMASTTNLVSRRDVVVVASVSCIFGLGSPKEYKESVVPIQKGDLVDRQKLLRRFADLQYTRSEFELKRGGFRVRGDVIELVPAAEEFAYRIELFGDEVDSLALINPTSGELLADTDRIDVYPAVQYVLDEDRKEFAINAIKAELENRVMELRGECKLLEAQRLLARTKYDLEMLDEVGFCNGIENYSRHLDGRQPGERPYCLLDFFPADDWLMLIDESHVTLPQIKAMYHGDRHRKETLVEHGFRLPSALDNRPLKYDEVEELWPQVVFVSATPGEYELENSGGEVVEQIIRPTGLVDPVIDIRPADGQVPDLLKMIQERKANGERTLVTTLTKRLAEDLASYLADQDIDCRYLHSEVETLDRVVILRELREGQFDVLVGVNLLREGLDLPEVSLVAIMDADKTGFLRSGTSLIQQIGRAARNENAYVVMYADEVTPAMKEAIDETNRRREKQLAYNAEHGITPKTIKKAIRRGIEMELRARKTAKDALSGDEKEYDRAELLQELEAQMLEAAQALEFEKAASIRDKVKEIKAAPAMTKVKLSKKKSKPKPGTPGTKVRKLSKKRSSR
ncbi:excinuclease ABC subunit UvrB [Algisphaera agarilytica]|uniref:UvrABC system protein B n=1 Tax=Algisphaera agarilytica TaxID=1385975 RepID=A0A7X0H9P6_9BACT|nr:excinuclease ABC subunit UvrB [Algisphaera agarilytica]MBB6431668.1 excinuclease ABC subunit B [Algisphaera agarilytica]